MFKEPFIYFYFKVSTFEINKLNFNLKKKTHNTSEVNLMYFKIFAHFNYLFLE